MKKRFVYILSVVIFGCTNPSMEDGFVRLESILNELESTINNIDVSQMITDINNMNVIIDQLIIDVEEYSYKMEEFNSRILEIKLSLQDILLEINGITEEVNGEVVVTGGLATSQQMQDLLSQIQEFQKGVDILVAIADYDYDGIRNALDKCPNTPLSEINNIDTDGCSPSQKED